MDDERDEDRRDKDTGLHLMQPCGQNLGPEGVAAHEELDGAKVVKAKESIATVELSIQSIESP